MSATLKQINCAWLCVLALACVCVCRKKHEEEWREADSFGDLIPLDISWLGECGGTPCFMELAWIISLDGVLPRGTAE